MRTPIIAGNWKMHKTVSEAVELVNSLKDKVKDAKCEVVVCPTFVCLPAVIQSVKGTNIKGHRTCTLRTRVPLRAKYHP